MADNPQNPLSLGQWKTVNLEFPQEVQALSTSITNVANTVNTGLSLVLTVLDTLKSFSIGYVDPLKALTDVVINQINAFITDLDKIGLYIAGDWNLLTYPFDNLRGGYNAFERRMVARLTDRKDSTRPDFSTASSVGAFFFYHSVQEVSDIRDIISFVKKFIEFFQIILDDNKALPVGNNLKVKYGLSSLLSSAFETLPNFLAAYNRVPDQFNVSWDLSTSSAKTATINLPLPAPGGFLVEISTVRDGLKIFYERPAPDSPSVVGNNSTKTTLKEYGPVVDPTGTPLVLFGGIQQLEFEDDIQYNANVDADGNLRKGGKRVYAIKTQADKVPIDLSLLKQGSRYLLQRTFFVDTRQITPTKLFTLGNRFDITIDTKDLPYEADFEVKGNKVVATISKQPGTYYVRVTPVSELITQNEEFKYTLDQSDFGKSGTPVQTATTSNKNGKDLHFGTDIGEKSQATTITIPSNDTAKFLDGIAAALAVSFLSRSDLPLMTEQVQALGGPLTTQQVNDQLDSKTSTVVQGVAATATGLEGTSTILKQMYRDLEGEHKKKKVDPRNFRQKLLLTCRKFASELYEDMGPTPALEKQIADITTNLRTWKWTDSKNTELSDVAYMFPAQTILESLQSTDLSNGLGANPWSVGAAEEIVERNFFFNNIIGKRTPGFLQTQKISVHEVFKSQMTQEEIDVVLNVKPHLEIWVKKYREIDPLTRKAIYKFPTPFLGTLNDFSFVLGSADSSPVLYGNQENLIRGEESGKVLYCRNLIDSTLYNEARIVLQIAASAKTRPLKDGEWVATRLFTAIPELNQFFQTINGWVKSIQLGSKSATDGILAYIDFLRARVTELQNLINRIDSVLQTLVKFKFSSASLLPIVANGTEGIIAGLVNSTNKPPDGSTAYSAGVVILAGGAPSFITTLLGSLGGTT